MGGGGDGGGGGGGATAYVADWIKGGLAGDGSRRSSCHGGAAADRGHGGSGVSFSKTFSQNNGDGAEQTIDRIKKGDDAYGWQ